MKTLLCSFLLTISVLTFGQYQPTAPSLAKSMVKINFLSPGVEWERRLTNKLSLNVHAGVAPGFMYSSATEGKPFQFTVIPTTDIQLRYYYNLNTRQQLGRSITGNSGNFFALHAGAAGSDLISGTPQQLTTSLGLVWGAQRTYTSGFNLSGFIGPGVQIGVDGKPRFTVVSGLRVGWALNNKRLKQEAAVQKLMLNE